MSSFKYEVEFNGPADIAGQLKSIKAALEECSIKSLGFSQNTQRGLEAESARFKVWAGTLDLRRDSTGMATTVLTNAVATYREAEKTVNNRMQQARSAAATGGGTSTDSGNAQYGGSASSGGGSSGMGTGVGDGAYGGGSHPNGCINWDNSTGSGGSWWSSIPPGIRWPIIGGIIGGIIGNFPGVGFPPGSIWELIRNWFNRRNPEAGVGDGDSGHIGDGEDGYGDSESNGEGIGDNDGYSDSDGEHGVDDSLNSGEDFNPGGGIGIGGMPGMGSNFDTGAQSGGGAFSNPDLDFDDALSSVNAQNGYSEFGAKLADPETGDFAAIGFTDSSAQSGLGAGASAAGMGTGDGSTGDADYDTGGGGMSGIATPLIAIGGLAVGAAAGVGIAGRTGGADKKGSNTKNADSANSTTPVVEARQTGGLFAGNLEGRYIILGTSLVLAFAGLSISASVMNKDKKKSEDDRYRIGYGISAIFTDYDNYINLTTAKG